MLLGESNTWIHWIISRSTSVLYYFMIILFSIVLVPKVALVWADKVMFYFSCHLMTTHAFEKRFFSFLNKTIQESKDGPSLISISSFLFIKFLLITIFLNSPSTSRFQYLISKYWSKSLAFDIYLQILFE